MILLSHQMAGFLQIREPKLIYYISVIQKFNITVLTSTSLVIKLGLKYVMVRSTRSFVFLIMLRQLGVHISSNTGKTIFIKNNLFKRGLYLIKLKNFKGIDVILVYLFLNFQRLYQSFQCL